jgi:hypothetical protein
VWTTDSSKEGRKFSDSSISYETDKILSYDNRGGFVSLTERIDPLSKIKGEFFYSSNDLEYRRLNINPIFNSDIKKYMVVFYLIPNVGAEEEAIHYLLVDKKGKIVYTSQGAGGTYPDLSLEGGSWNPDTIVGMNYIDESSDDGFVSLYSIGYDNPFGYLILAECTLKETFGIDEIRKVDLRREGGTLVPSKKKEVYKRNQRLLQSKYGYGESGEEVQHTNVLVIDVPITVLKEYGGDLTRKEVEQNIKRNLSMGVYPLINWKYPRADIVIDQIDSASVSISCEWLGGDYTYTLLRKTGEEDWEVIDYIVAPERGTLEWTDDTISTNTTYMYTIRIELDDLQYPLYNIVTIRTAE